MDAFFTGYRFSPHRHDTYALGITLNGVHNFTYQKSMRHSLPGNAVIIHPDFSAPPSEWACPSSGCRHA
ncbi:MAG: AraC family ligand binding domain-containing protein [Alcaligenes sp.]